MTYIITSLCLRDGSCVEVCPVDCIVPGKPKDQWPWFYIDPDTCIDCNACVPQCPYEAIYPEIEVPAAFEPLEGTRQSKSVGTPGFDEPFIAANAAGTDVTIPATRELKPGKPVNLTEDIQPNYDFFTEGEGYWEGWQDGVAVDDPETVGA